jgi:hypothetical protein
MKWPSRVLIDSHEDAVEGGRDGSIGGTDTSHGAAVVGGWIGIGIEDETNPGSGYRV